jgi:anti-sigma B factor antagonist
MQVSETNLNNCTVFALEGNLDMLHAAILKERIVSLIQEEKYNMILDLEKIKFVDSSGFGLMMSMSDRLGKMGGGLRIINVPKTITQIFKIAKIEKAIPILSSVEEASNSFNKPE